jgi:hydroxymethylglutaryl-CoA lyase
MKLVECPRDAMQGFSRLIPTAEKVEYLNLLLEVGFDTLDFGSFVSPKAIPQMADTSEVYQKLNWRESSTKLLSIVGNERGAETACRLEGIRVLGFPFSISPEFQMRNTHASQEEALERIFGIWKLAESSGKDLVVYLSMGFGNPYGDEFSLEVVNHWARQISEIGPVIFAVSDTIGVSNRQNIKEVMNGMSEFKVKHEVGVHLHSNPFTWLEKMEAAYASGCERFDSALLGFGGCPMAKDDLTGNIATENVIAFLSEKHALPDINEVAYRRAMQMANRIFLNNSSHSLDF